MAKDPERPASSLAVAGVYADLLRRVDLTAQRFMEIYSQPIVLRPTRFLGYGGRGWDASGRMAT
ncbi:hypothetical protein BH20CHL8_BH20CHL8_01210 [soil metagenome]